MARKTTTSSEVKARWNAANYRRYQVYLRIDDDREFGYRFDVTARWTAAVDMADYYEEEVFFELNA